MNRSKSLPTKSETSTVEIKKGINSDVTFHNFPDGSREVTVRYGLAKGGFEKKEALEMLEDILVYHQELEKRDVPLPEIKDKKVEFDSEVNKHTIVKVVPWTGAEVGKLIETSDWEKERETIEKLVKRMLEIITPICRERKSGWETEIGIDPRSANFTLDGQNKLWFIDLFPPRFRKNGVAIVEWPWPKGKLGTTLGYFKHFDVRGILLCLLAHLARVKPEAKSRFEELMLEEAKKMMTEKELAEFAGELQRTAWVKLRNLLKKNKSGTNFFQDAREIISSAIRDKVFDVDYNIYTLREIATELAAERLISVEELEDFFRASHFEDQLTEEQEKRLQVMLLNFLQRYK